MANASELRLSYVPEVTYGTTPVAAMDDLRFTSEGLKQRTDIVESKEIRDDRQVADVQRVSIGAEGPIAFEFSYEAFDDFLVAALFSSGWSTVQTASTTITTTPATGTLTDSATSAAFANFAVGQWIRIVGFTDATKNGYFKIISKASSNVITVAGKVVLPSETAKAMVITMGPQIVNGVTATSFSIEKEWTDLANEFAVYVGMMIDRLALDIPSDGLLTGSFNLIGKHEDSLAATASNGTKNAAPTKKVLNGIDDAVYVAEGTPAVNTANEYQTMSLSMQLNNKLRQRNVLGTLGPIEQKAGTVELTGTLRAYFASKTIADKYLAFTQSAIAIALEDADGNGIVIEIPALHFEDGQRVAGGVDTDVIMDLSWRARRHATEDVMIRIAKFDA